MSFLGDFPSGSLISKASQRDWLA